jgi:hypothetical protein
MSSRHGNTRRQAYGRRMKDLRTRRSSDMDVDLEGPSGWNRGGAWDSDSPMPRVSMTTDRSASSIRAR